MDKEQKDAGAIPHVGIQGNSPFPGQSAHADAFVPFPTMQLRDGTVIIDREVIKRDFMDSPVDHWDAFCKMRGYNPKGITLSPKDWVREKRYRGGWNRIRMQLETNASEVGPQLLMQAVNAAVKVPESLSMMLELCRFQLSVMMSEAQADQVLMAQNGGKPVPVNKRNFRATPGDIACLANAMNTTSAQLFKSLGIDNATGIDVEKWHRTIEGSLGKLDAMDRGADRKDTIEVEIMGQDDIRTSLKDAMAKWLDKPKHAPTPPPSKEVEPESESDLIE